MKKLFKILFIAVLIGTLISFVSTAACVYPHYVVTATSGLNVRYGPGTGYKIYTTLPSGTAITISQVSGGWGKIYTGQNQTIDGKWVSMAYLTQYTITSLGTGKVKTSSGCSLNMRQGPTTSCRWLASIPNGKSVIIRGYTANGWLYVSYNGVHGFVSSTYIVKNSYSVTSR